MKRQHLGPLSALDQELPSSKGYVIDTPDGRREILLVRSTQGLHAYYNHCPHTGAPLDWMPDRFLSLDRRHIQCAIHGALFQLHDGACLYGPCQGRGLTPVAIEVVDGELWALPQARPPC